ncbi:ATP-dependent DNA helicase II subunit 1 [Choanephora cucurbitarum]|uniref:ATP-dependent DNA helicase II subunit 1 n=1 Tax=Choanephora cucurbitarum TaxID=101091 RepID=A0A1C7N9Z5_9FUNG|nr:ATP-dependent DNA helicase II subunit 1 [Choanephora cucurbitarum]
MSSSYFDSIPFDEEDEDIKEESSNEYNLKECTVYAIDCRPSMFQTEAGEVPFQTALKAVRSKLLDTLYTRPNDQMSIVFFNTISNNNTANKDHIYLLQPLDIPDAPRIKELDLLTEDLSLFQQKYGSSDQLFPFSDFFTVCSEMMANAPKFALKRIILITDNDDPTGQNPDYRRIALQKAKDLTQVGVDHVLFGIDRPDHAFDRTLFYSAMMDFDDTLLSDKEDEFEHRLLSTTGRLMDMFERIKSFQTTTRSEFSIPFHIAPQLTIGIKGFNMVIEKKAEQPKYFFTSGEQLKEVKAITRWRCVDTKEYLTPIDIHKSYAYGGEKVILTEQEVAQLKTVNEPGLLVLGYRGQDALKSYHQISHPYFIYPDESQFKESKRIFCLLLKVLYEKQQLAICSLVRKNKTVPKMVALLPQLETLDQEGHQLDPPGFQLIVLPYADEIRPVPPYVVADEYEKGIEKAKVLIDRLKITEGYKPIQYPNPYLENHKYMIQKVALENTVQPKDHTLPQIDISDDIKDFKQSVGLDLISAWFEVKRKNDEHDDMPIKRMKKNDMTIQEHWSAGTLTTVTNPSLKAFLVDVKITPKRKKADMIDQIDAYFRNHIDNMVYL